MKRGAGADPFRIGRRQPQRIGTGHAVAGGADLPFGVHRRVAVEVGDEGAAVADTGGRRQRARQRHQSLAHRRVPEALARLHDFPACRPVVGIDHQYRVTGPGQPFAHHAKRRADALDVGPQDHPRMSPVDGMRKVAVRLAVGCAHQHVPGLDLTGVGRRRQQSGQGRQGQRRIEIPARKSPALPMAIDIPLGTVITHGGSPFWGRLIVGRNAASIDHPAGAARLAPQWEGAAAKRPGPGQMGWASAGARLLL